MPTSPTPAADRPAEGPLGPITPIRCTKPGCHWACHGVPDKYADSRARIVREHLAAEHAPTPEPSPAAVWVDGDPLMEAMAAAVYEQCRTEPSIVVDDPRNIAAVAATVARQLLGTTTAEGAEPTDRDVVEAHELALGFALAAPPAPADRAAVLREAAKAVDNTEFPDEYVDLFDNGARWASRLLRRLADGAAAGVQPPTTSETEPARRLTPREHDRAWHAIEGSAGEPGADPGTVLAAVLHALRIDAPTPAEEQAASPSRRATPPAAPAAPEETR
ncbi:hypothetical protein ACWFRT_13820 [Streptomyces anulatus]